MKKLILFVAIVAIALPAVAERSMTGGYALLTSPDPAVFIPGTTVTCEFFVYNGSVDVEWTAEVWFLFPCCFNVLSGWYDDLGQGWTFFFDVFGDCQNGALFYDGDGGWGEIYDDTSGYFYVEVYVGEDCECGPDVIHWYQQGDIYGDEPHFVEGFIDIEICDQTGAEESSWSTLKALY